MAPRKNPSGWGPTPQSYNPEKGETPPTVGGADKKKSTTSDHYPNVRGGTKHTERTKEVAKSAKPGYTSGGIPTQGVKPRRIDDKVRKRS